MKKKLLIVIISIIVIMLIILLIIFFPTIKNNQYTKNLLKEINTNTNTNIKNITKVYKDNNYYIIKTKEKIIVLDLNYDEKFTKDSIIDSTLPLSYRRGNLYYKERKRKKDKIVYNFYSTDDLSLAFTSVVGGV